MRQHRKRDVCEWHVAAFAAMHHLGRDWSNNGQRSILALDC
jgi:hypothetical protein